MAFDYKTPGVYINYKMDGQLTVIAASTSTAVFIGPTVIGRSITGTGSDTVVTPTYVTSLTEYGNVFSTPGARSGVVCLPTPGNAVVDSMGHAVRGFFMNGGKNAYIVSLSLTDHETATMTLSVTDSGGGDPLIYLVSAISPGAWGNDISVTLTASRIGAGFLDVEIVQTLSSDGDDVEVTETFTGLRADALEDTSSNVVGITLLQSGDDGFAGPHAASLDVSAAPPAGPLNEVTGDLGALNPGVNSSATTETDLGGVFDALRDFDDISLVALPDSIWPDDEGAYGLALAHCQAMKDRITLIQLDDGTTNFEVSVPNDKYAAVYFPRVNVTLPIAGNATVSEPVNSVGHVAGVYARTDAERGPWTAPAGMHAGISGMTSFTVDISHSFQERMNPEHVNALRVIQGVPVVWGARTRERTIYTYVPVMRTAILIADSLRETLNNYVFAKNTEILWANVKAGVNAFMDGLYSQGAFQGATPGQAFRVAVGVPESMTQADARSGLLKVNVAFAPALVAEFIEINIEQIFEPAG